MKKEIILLSVLCIIILYVFSIYKIEEMENTSDTSKTTTEIKEAVKQLYLADVESIRNLSNVATKLQTNGLDIPGKIKITGDLSVDGITTMSGYVLNTPDNHQITCAGRQHTFGPTEFYILNKLGLVVGKNKDWGDSTGNASIQGNLSIDGITTMYGSVLNTPANHQITCAGRQHTDGPTEFYILNKLGLVVGKEWGGNGNASIQGNLAVDGNIFNAKNKAKYIRVGNMYSTDIPELSTGIKRTDSVSPLAYPAWLLVEIKVYDHNGTNVALNRPVTRLRGNPLIDREQQITETNNKIENITNGKIFNNSSTIPTDNLYPKNNNNIMQGYMGNNSQHQLEIELDIQYDISHIELYNRFNFDFTVRMNGTVVELINHDKTFINRTIHTGIWTGTYSKEYIL